MSIVKDMETNIFLKKQDVWRRADKVRVSMYKMFHMETDDPETQAYKSARGIWLCCVRSFGNEGIQSLFEITSYSRRFKLQCELIELADILQETLQQTSGDQPSSCQQ